MTDWAQICEGCGKCCGPVPFETEFLMQHAHLYQELPDNLDYTFPGLVIPTTVSLDCVFLEKLTKRCVIYDERPEVCRLMGTIPELPCAVAEKQ